MSAPTTDTRYPYRVTGDFSRLVYSRHSTEAAAVAAARRLARNWGWSHPGSEPVVQRLTADGWVCVLVVDSEAGA